jgi:pSer/pThr/pTyr-binding forkhead associated (FHA) protein
VALTNLIEKLGRAVFESPFSAGRLSQDAPELAEIRLAVLDEVKAKSHRVSGRDVFPFDIIRIHLRGIPESQAHIFSTDFVNEYLTGQIREELTRSDCRFPSKLRAAFETSPELPTSREGWLSVTVEANSPEPQARTETPLRPGLLLVRSGKANVAELPLDKARINIGRTAQVQRPSGPSRRNDLAFSEDTEINRTVSREHAHILRSENTGEYRLFNDRVYKGEENCGLWIVRESASQPVHRSSRGMLLLPGDEIYLGKAVIGFLQN